MFEINCKYHDYGSDMSQNAQWIVIGLMLPMGGLNCCITLHMYNIVHHCMKTFLNFFRIRATIGIFLIFENFQNDFLYMIEKKHIHILKNPQFIIKH